MSGTSSTDLPRVTRQDGETFIVLAAGCVDELSSHLTRLGRSRAYVVTGSSLGSGRIGQVVRNPGIRPRLVLYDPELAIDTPPDLTAGTGINALAHCVEGLYSNDAGDAERAMAVGAATLLVEHLPKAFARPEDLAHRYNLFEGSMLAGVVLARAGMGVHHGLCHVLGGRDKPPHRFLKPIFPPPPMPLKLPAARPAL